MWKHSSRNTQQSKKKKKIKQNMGGEGGSAGIANESRLLVPCRREERERKEGMENPKLPGEIKKNKEISVQVRTCKSCTCKGRKSHKVQITKGIPRFLSCTEEDKTFHTISELSGD